MDGTSQSEITSISSYDLGHIRTTRGVVREFAKVVSLR